MRSIDWLVIAAGLAAAAWVNWYFFLADRGVAPAVAAPPADAGSPQQVDIVIEGAYAPATIRVAAGRPVRLVFDRRETSSCSEEVVFPAFALRRFLPAHEKTAVEVTPPAPGIYEFACGMGMLHGRLIAE